MLVGSYPTHCSFFTRVPITKTLPNISGDASVATRLPHLSFFDKLDEEGRKLWKSALTYLDPKDAEVSENFDNTFENVLSLN
jgi:hypothetical protein